MNKITILAISAVFVASILAITAFEAQAVKPTQGGDACPAENVQHWATYNWQPSGTITHPTLPSISGPIHQLEIQVSPDEAYLKEDIVLARLIELGYLDATSQPLVLTDISSVFPFGTSSTICAEN